MKKIIIAVIFLISVLSFGQKVNGNQTIEGSQTITGNLTVTGTVTSAGEQSSSNLLEKVNWFNPALIEYGQVVSNTTGNLGSSGGFDSSGKQAVLPNTRYYIVGAEFPTGIYQPQSGIRSYYDVNGNFVSWDTLEADNSFITPANVYFLQWSNSAGNFDNLTQLIKAPNNVDPIVLEGAKAVPPGAEFDTNYINVIDQELRRIFLPLYGKKWVLLGDSITQQGNYIVNVKRTTGLIDIVNHGFAGRLVGDMASTDLTQADVDAADVITIYGGTNNYGLNPAPLGTIADDSTTNSFYGRVRKELQIIHGFIETSSVSDVEKMQKLVVFITPTARGTAQGYTYPNAGSGGKTIAEITQAIKDVCAEFGTPVFDNLTMSGLNATNITRHSDELHPNFSGSLYGIPLGRFLNMAYRGY